MKRKINVPGQPRNRTVPKKAELTIYTAQQLSGMSLGQLWEICKEREIKYHDVPGDMWAVIVRIISWQNVKFGMGGDTPTTRYLMDSALQEIDISLEVDEANIRSEFNQSVLMDAPLILTESRRYRAPVNRMPVDLEQDSEEDTRRRILEQSRRQVAVSSDDENSGRALFNSIFGSSDTSLRAEFVEEREHSPSYGPHPQRMRLTGLADVTEPWEPEPVIGAEEFEEPDLDILSETWTEMTEEEIDALLFEILTYDRADLVRLLQGISGGTSRTYGRLMTGYLRNQASLRLRVMRQTAKSDEDSN